MQQIFQKIVNFIKYHNAFTIGLAVVFLLGGAVLANEQIRDAIIGETLVEREGIDNTALLAADLDNFDINMRVENVREDGENYYVDYSFKPFAIRGNVWQEVVEYGTLTVAEIALSGKDLGLYVAEELGELIDDRLAYLKEVQQMEREKGITLVRETTKYSGLIGLVLNPQTKELPGYEPVVKPSPPEPFVGIANIGSADESAERASPSEPSPSEGEENLPDTIIDASPAVLTSSTEAVFVFRCDRPDRSDCNFQCKVNDFDWLPCQSPKEYVNLIEGQYTFKVFVVDELGKTDPTPATFFWTVQAQTSPSEPSLPAEPEQPQATSTDSQATSTDSTSTDSQATSTNSQTASTSTNATQTGSQPQTSQQTEPLTTSEPPATSEPIPEPPSACRNVDISLC